MEIARTSYLSICALVQGWYGQRIISNLKKRAPNNWVINVYEFPRELPIFIEEPKELIPSQVSHCDLILSLGEHPTIAALLPDLAEITGAKAVIAPIDNPSWVPPGIRRQVSKELERKDVAFAFPKPFCSLDVNTGNKFIDDFAKRFGKPELRITLKDAVIESIDISRGSPCGATHSLAEKLFGEKKSKAATNASLFVQTYPCLASRMKDPEFGKSIIHVAAYITKGVVESSLLDAHNASAIEGNALRNEISFELLRPCRK